MDIVITILKTLGIYLILMLLSTNLIGGVIRSLVEVYKVYNDDNTITAEMFGKGIIRVTIVFSVLLIGYLLALFYFFNLWAVLAAMMIMASRIPDLLWEIKTGQKITLKNMPKARTDWFFLLLGYSAIPMVWYAFYVAG